MPKKKSTASTPLKSSLMHKPFDRLKGLVESDELPLSRPAHKSFTEKKEPAPAPQNEKQLFLEAMEGVDPISKDHVPPQHGARKPVERPRYIIDNDPLASLVRLVNHGEGFIVSHTPEYMEGTGVNVHEEFAKRLHRGDFSIQAHIDLHGLNAGEAKEAFESFLKASVNSGKRAVLVIHGRGLSSPGESVLKNKVREWLSRGHWLKWVIAFASAQMYDGGAGATYVLLRQRPVSKKSGKRQ